MGGNEGRCTFLLGCIMGGAFGFVGMRGRSCIAVMKVMDGSLG